MRKPLSLEHEYNLAFQRGLQTLKEGKVLLFPTDTVYGIGGDAGSAKATEKIYALKGRDKDKPLAVIMSGLEMMREWCELSSESMKAAVELLPGPYTFVLKLKAGKQLAGQSEKIGVRVPNHFFIRKMVLEFGRPITATSANVSGEGEALRIADVHPKVARGVSLAIDGGETAHSKPSTVIDFVERKVLRKGAGDFEFGR